MSRGQQVRRELHAAHRAVDRPRERLGEHRLADAGDVLDQQVALGEHHRDGQPDDVALALDDALDGPPDAGRRVGQGREVGLGRPRFPGAVLCALGGLAHAQGSSSRSPAGRL